MFVVEDHMAVDMIRALKTYRGAKSQAARIAQAEAIMTMAKKLKELAEQDARAKLPPHPRSVA